MSTHIFGYTENVRQCFCDTMNKEEIEEEVQIYIFQKKKHGNTVSQYKEIYFLNI